MAVVLTAGAWWVVRDARQAVMTELADSLTSTSAILELAIEQQVGNEKAPTAEFLRQVAAAVNTRHLDVAITRGKSDLLQQSPHIPDAPSWFVRWVHPQTMTLVRTLTVPGAAAKIVLRADPAAEIDESWRAARHSIFQLILFTGLSSGLISLFVQLTLRPLRALSDALHQVAVGHYDVRVEPTHIPELDILGEHFNRMVESQARNAAAVAELTHRALIIREEERRHLAHELHDEMGQSISAIKALAVAITQRGEDQLVRTKQSAATIAEISTHIYDQVRKMMSQLRPTALDELGAVAAIAELIDGWNSHHENTFCAFSASASIPRLTGILAINLFRIVQETLNNIANHAQATHATIRLEDDVTSSMLRVTIEDNGIGFEPANTPRGLGLVGISERVQVLHGGLKLAARPGEGTKFTITIPYAGPEQPEQRENEYQDQNSIGG